MGSVSPALAQQAGGGSPLAPKVLFIDFSNTIPADGSRAFGRVGFEDLDEDIVLVKFEVIEATEFTSFSFNPKIQGRTEGVFEFFIFSRIEQTIVLSVSLVDEAGNQSFPAEFSFNAIALVDVIWSAGGFGSAQSQFMDIGAVAADSEGNIFITDFANDRVQEFSSDGIFLGVIIGPGFVNAPVGIAIDHQDNFYIAEAGARRVQKFSRNGVPLLSWGEFGNELGQFNQPSGIAVDRFGNVYVADQGSGYVQKFDPNGNPLIRWNGQESGIDQMNSPMDIFVDSQDNVYIADLGNDRILRFSTDGSLITQWGSRGSRDGQLNEPRGVFVDQAGDVYVTDKENHRLQKFSREGVFLAKTGSFGSGAGQFIQPIDMVVDRDFNIYIADEGNHRVQKLQFRASDE
jgi:DNA-binding beta-propeller fold protein YncE